MVSVCLFSLISIYLNIVIYVDPVYYFCDFPDLFLLMVFFSGMMIAENWINDVAIVLEKEPNDVRYANLFKDGQKTHYNQTIEGNSLERCFLECLEQSEHEKNKTELNEFNKRSKWKKRGIAVIPTMYGLAFTASFMNQGGKKYSSSVICNETDQNID